MSETAAKLLEQILTLPKEERLMIAEQLQNDLDDGDHEAAVVNDPAFRTELARRIETLASGSAELIDGDQVFREARERLQKRRLA